MSRKVAEEFECDSCGAEYTVTYVHEEIMEEPDYCPFCQNELETFDIEDEFQGELDFEDD